MENYTIQRPSLLLAVCAPSASWLPSTASAAVRAAKPAPDSQVHQVQTQAELARTLVLTGGSNGTTGSISSKGTKGFVGNVSVETMTDGVSGVPPRGRPV